MKPPKVDASPSSIKTFSCPFQRKCPSELKKDDLFFMSLAYNEAINAWESGEIPIGAIIVHQQLIIASAHNATERLKDATAHAELLAITQASRTLGDWRLHETALYVTKEPCPMCAGAAILSRIPRIIFGCQDAKTGAFGGALALHHLEKINHRPHISPCVMPEECYTLLHTFFEMRRKQSSRIENG